MTPTTTVRPLDRAAAARPLPPHPRADARAVRPARRVASITSGRSRCATRSCSTKATCRRLPSTRCIKKGLGGAGIDADLETIFARGIDPESEATAIARGNPAWPSREVVATYAGAADRADRGRHRDGGPRARGSSAAARRAGALDDPRARGDAPGDARLHVAPAAIRARSGSRRTTSRCRRGCRRAAPAAGRTSVPIPAGDRRRSAPTWTTRRSRGTTSCPPHTSDVDAFDIDAHNVTNARVHGRSSRRAATTIRAGGATRTGHGCGERRDASAVLGAARATAAGTWRGMFERVPLPRDWPVYVTWAEAHAFARWRGGGCRPKRSSIAPRSARRTGASGVSVGRRAAGRPPGNFDFERWDPEPVGAHPDGASAFGVHDLVGNGWEWTSTVFGAVRRLRAAAVVSGVLGGLLRRRALRDEGRVAGDRARAGAPRVPQLVPAALSVRLRDVPAASAAAMSRTQPRRSAEPRASFAAEVRDYLQRTPRQLPSKYFYDALGSALFEAICRLPWYRITRAESALLERHAREILRAAARGRSTIAELGCGSGDKLAIADRQRRRATVRSIQLVDISRGGARHGRATASQARRLSTRCWRTRRPTRTA